MLSALPADLDLIARIQAASTALGAAIAEARQADALVIGKGQQLLDACFVRVETYASFGSVQR
jgi:hypothetical protein